MSGAKRSSDHLSPPVNDVQKRYHWEPSDEILKQNKYYALSQPSTSSHINLSEEDVSTNETNEQQIRPKIPPIFLIGPLNHKEVIIDIKATVTSEFNTTYANNKLKINVTNENDYRQLIKHYVNNKIEHYTYRNPASKPLSVVIKNVPPSRTEEEIIEALNENNIPILKLTRLYNKNKIPIPVCAVDLEANEKSQGIYNINRLLDSVVVVEKRRINRGTPQCYRCQRFGHTKNYCNLPPRCVKCTENHHYKECKKKADQPPKCINCGGEHPANFRGCKYYIDSTQTSNQRKSNNDKQYKPSQPNSVSYANITKQNLNTKTENNNPSFNDNFSFTPLINQLLNYLSNLFTPFIEQLKSFFITNILSKFTNAS